jgi:hypothetical protein
MRVYTHIMTSAVIIFAQVASQAVQLPATAQLTHIAQAGSTSTHKIQLVTNTHQPLVIASINPSFDEAVVNPLRATQAVEEASRKAALKAQKVVRKVTQKAAPLVIGGSDAFAQLRFCEAGGDYTKNTGNGYFGAYQYSISTWANFGGFSRPDLAPPEVQDAKARETQARRGWSPWPSCARKLGLM